jgi:uncharacterized membrane-anchored protein
MGRIIVNNKSDLTDFEAMGLVMSVMVLGRISNDDKQYCYLTTFRDGAYHIVTDLRKKSDSFTVYKVHTKQ